MSEQNFTSPPPHHFAADVDTAPDMSTGATLSGIFFEPGATFEALRRRPRFLVAMLIIIVATFTFTTLLYQRIGYETMVRQAIENSPRTADMPADQKERVIEMQTGPIFKTIAYCSPLIGVALFIFIGGALYLLGVMAMGKSINYWQALSVWAYSTLPPVVLVMLLNIVLLFLKSPEDIDATTAQRGFVHANPSLLIDTTAHPVLGTAVGALDLFAIYGLFLAALGLRKVGRLSAGAAWGVVLAIWLVGLLIRLAIASFSGSAMA